MSERTDGRDVKPSRRTWPAFVIVGFLAGVMTVIAIAWLRSHVLH